MIEAPRLGVLTSVGSTVDAFFPGILATLRSMGCTVFVAAGTDTSQDSTVIDGLTRNPSPKNIRARTSLTKWVANNDLSAVLVSTATASALTRFFVREVPVVYFCHGLHWVQDSKVKGFPWKLIEVAVLDKTAGIIVLNREDEHWFATHAPKAKLARLKYGVGIDPAQYPRTPLSGTTNVVQLCWIGEFSSRKNPTHAVEIADHLRSVGFAFHLSMLGTGKHVARTKRLITKLGLQHHITLVGHAPARPFLTESSALVHTARWEGLPRVFLEALAVGRPIFSYDIKGSRDLPCTHLTPYGDRELMAASLAGHDWHSPNTEDEYPSLEDLSHIAATNQIVSLLQLVDESFNGLG